MAARLRKETNADVELTRGGLGELSVYIDDQKVIDTNRFLYPIPGKLVRRVKELIAV